MQEENAAYMCRKSLRSEEKASQPDTANAKRNTERSPKKVDTFSAARLKNSRYHLKSSPPRRAHPRRRHRRSRGQQPWCRRRSRGEVELAAALRGVLPRGVPPPMAHASDSVDKGGDGVGEALAGPGQVLGAAPSEAVSTEPRTPGTIRWASHC